MEETGPQSELELESSADGKSTYRNAFEKLTKQYLNQLQDTYLLTLGEFSPYEDNFSKEFQFFWLFFIIATILNLTIMLNLLIALIGETYGRVDSQKIEYRYKEKAIQIRSLQRIIGKCVMKDENKQQLLFFAKKYDKQDEGEVDTMEELNSQVNSIKEEIEAINTKIEDLSKLVATETSHSDSQVAKFVMRQITELKDYVLKRDKRHARKTQ